VPSWKPADPPEPDEGDEWRFRPLEERDPFLAAALVGAFAARWLREAGLSADREDEVPDTIELMVASEWDPEDGTHRLRLRSWFTGETRWLHEWDGEPESAHVWIAEVADLCGAWVRDERAIGGFLAWDE
jgi:hypothetical protein